MKFRPCIDLHNGKVKQIVGGTLNDAGAEVPVTNFETDLSPAYFAGMYKNDNLSGGHVIMLGPGNEEAAISALRGFSGGMQAGGGITPQNARWFLDAGASHVIVTSFIFENGRLSISRIESMAEAVGKDRLVIDLSCRKKDDLYYVVTDRWQKFSDLSITEKNLKMLADYCDEYLVHAVDVEGKREGVDRDLVSLLADVSPITTTYAGGIRSLADMEEIFETGENRLDATVGSALDIFGGTLKYKALVEWNNNRQEI